jgi:ribulose-bisphosphate carboxylase small chain
MARLTQGQFSLLPDLTDEQIAKQIEYAIKKRLK